MVAGRKAGAACYLKSTYIQCSKIPLEIAAHLHFVFLYRAREPFVPPRLKLPKAEK